MKSIKLFLLCILGLIPQITSAHVKWFVDSDTIIQKYHGMTTFYSWGSKEVLIWSVVIIITVFLFSIFDGVTKTPKKLLDFGFQHEKQINRIAQIVLGIFLVTVSFIWKIILVPNIHVDNTPTIVLQILQALLGGMYIFNIAPRKASIGLLLLCLGLCIHQGVVVLLENAILVSLACYFLIIHSNTNSFIFKKYYKHSVEIVRIGTGISLITLAVTEKLLYPELGMEFLSVHHWNFMQPLFPWFSDKLFVLSTGFAEMIFGILFILGYITRITTLLIAVFFGISVTTMLVQFGEWEVEDLVVYSAAILFIFYGHGRTKFFHFMWPNSFLQKKFFKFKKHHNEL